MPYRPAPITQAAVDAALSSYWRKNEAISSPSQIEAPSFKLAGGGGATLAMSGLALAITTPNGRGFRPGIASTLPDASTYTTGALLFVSATNQLFYNQGATWLALTPPAP